MEDKKLKEDRSWFLWRQDDHGNRFFIKCFSDKKEAEKALREYESKGHKQMYWIEPVKD